jgi:transcriptional regulator NrdR family protein
MVRLRNPEQCPHCHGDSRVTDSRQATQARTRRRECLLCLYRWTTYESLINPDAIRLRQPGRTT